MPAAIDRPIFPPIPPLPPFDMSQVAGRDIVPCTGCIRSMALAPFRIQGGVTTLPNNVLQVPSGAIITPQGAVYCTTCALRKPICRVCGCTDDAGCPEGCWWVSADLCSACVGMEETHAHG